MDRPRTLLKLQQEKAELALRRARRWKLTAEQKFEKNYDRETRKRDERGLRALVRRVNRIEKEYAQELAFTRLHSIPTSWRMVEQSLILFGPAARSWRLGQTGTISPRKPWSYPDSPRHR